MYSGFVATDSKRLESDRVGLCADCTHARQIESSRGSSFLLCQLSATDPRFPKYPRLPVLQCAGFKRITADA
jgi:hypothetical protein